ncbi:MAG: hypothetical protein CDV28_10656 [Candidatus Electronema aureum]|uniref:Uncharacterized protein n=1 Tax=Candidatus Electronema aureum TaxID=2005002 RepID=A0A521G3P0_9BACT|nr:MAG: hypothetical protein CDV28_10656 [Candidatus Electronema aureum]
MGDAAGTPVACDIQVSISELVDILKRIDSGETVCTSFMSRSEVNNFCLAAGFNRLWGGMIESEIACRPDPDFYNGVNTPNVVPKNETEIIVKLLKDEIVKGTTFTPDNQEPFKTDVLNDFLPKADGGLGYIWEYQFGLKVELEHGRTRGANVTNNHPLLTGIIVIAHLTEDTLYYARLWVMEVEGEIFNLKLLPEADTTDLEAELAIARQHLAAREAEKLSKKTTA